MPLGSEAKWCKSAELIVCVQWRGISITLD